MNLLEYQIQMIDNTLKEYSMFTKADSRTFTCHACERTFDNFAQDEYDRQYFMVLDNKICDLCYADWGNNGNFTSEEK